VSLTPKRLIQSPFADPVQVVQYDDSQVNAWCGMQKTIRENGPVGIGARGIRRAVRASGREAKPLITS
jgi:hypothetical protein